MLNLFQHLNSYTLHSMKTGYVYILASNPEGTLYIGVTSNLVQRIWQHKNKVAKGFTEKYHADKLVYFEVFEDMNEAIKREKQLKNWHREWKVNLIMDENPKWNDLYSSII